jgi:hypothetical protein
MALFVIRDLPAIWSLLGQQQTLIRTSAEWLGSFDPIWDMGGPISLRCTAWNSDTVNYWSFAPEGESE